MKLLAFCFALLVSLPAYADPAKWLKEVTTYEAADAKKAPKKGGIVFTGSSSIRLWKTLKKDFPNHNVIGRGIGGSQIEDAVFYADRLIFPYEPRMVVLYAGGNDINAGKTADQVVADFEAFVAKVRAKLPSAEIAYISIAGNPKRWAQIETIKDANRRIEEITKKEKGLKFIDTFSKMMGPDGTPKPDIFVADNLHMNPKGYAIWTEVVTPFLGQPDAKLEKTNDKSAEPKGSAN